MTTFEIVDFALGQDGKPGKGFELGEKVTLVCLYSAK